MEASPACLWEEREKGEGEQSSLPERIALQFQPNILELFLGRLWSVELCFYQAAGSFNKIFMAGKVLFMEIRLLKCLLGKGLTSRPCSPLPPSSPSAQHPLHSAPFLPSQQAPGSQENLNSLCQNTGKALAGKGALRLHVGGVHVTAKLMLPSFSFPFPHHHPHQGGLVLQFRGQSFSALAHCVGRSLAHSWALLPSSHHPQPCHVSGESLPALDPTGLALGPEPEAGSPALWGLSWECPALWFFLGDGGVTLVAAPHTLVHKLLAEGGLAQEGFLVAFWEVLI